MLFSSGCVQTPGHRSPDILSSSADQVETLPPGVILHKVRADLEAAIVERFGSAALKRAQFAEGYVLSRHYQGLPPPPSSTGTPRLPVAAILIFEQGKWFKAETGGGFQPLTAAQLRQWLVVLADTAPWIEPAYANPTCTDAGATYLIVSVPERPFLIRAANCAMPKSEGLGLAAINL